VPLTPEEFPRLTEFAVEHTGDGVLCLDTEGQILYANESSARILGRKAEEICQGKIFEVAPEINDALWRELWKEIRTHGSFAFELTLVASEVRLVQVDITVHHIPLSPRELACVFFRDIEERKRLQNLQQEFVSMASHELRTPMTVIREGVSQVMEGLRGDINESQKRALTIALNGIERLGRIIDELLDMSKIESGKVALKRDRLDLAAVAREVVATFQSLAVDRGLDLRITTPAGPVMAYADRDRLIQVLTNLISNAFKFTERGHIGLTVATRNGEVECSVSDTGIGLAPGDLEKIFNKFEQLGQVAFTGEKGTGLGLSICRGIIDLHKGRIWAESGGAGQGSRMMFVLPRQTGREVFHEQLTPLLKEVARRGGSLAAAIFKVEHLEVPHATESQTQSALTSLENLVRKQTGRSTDLLVRDVETVYLALPSTVKREAVRVADRIVKAFQENLLREGLGSKINLSVVLLGFPEETPDEDVFLNKVYEQGAA
jgi:PAS domain S-box-containing protein